MTEYSLPPGHPDHSCMFLKLDEQCPSCRARGVQSYEGANNLIVYDIPRGTNPPCIFCNGPTQRTGMCFTCQVCGNTTSC